MAFYDEGVKGTDCLGGKIMIKYVPTESRVRIYVVVSTLQ